MFQDQIRVGPVNMKPRRRARRAYTDAAAGKIAVDNSADVQGVGSGGAGRGILVITDNYVPGPGGQGIPCLEAQQDIVAAGTQAVTGLVAHYRRAREGIYRARAVAAGITAENGISRAGLIIIARLIAYKGVKDAGSIGLARVHADEGVGPACRIV